MLKKVDLKTLNDNVFSLIGDQWMLVTAGTPEHCNTMTASWGGLGVLWSKPVATIYVRPPRYTYEFIEKEDYFTLSFFDDSYRPQLQLCGSKSGRDVDKISACNFTVAAGEGNTPYIAQAKLVLVCKKNYRQRMDPACFIGGEQEKWYPNKDYHEIYMGEIVEAYVAEDVTEG